MYYGDMERGKKSDFSNPSKKSDFFSHIDTLVPCEQNWFKNWLILLKSDFDISSLLLYFNEKILLICSYFLIFLIHYLGLNVATPEESSDEAGVGPITPKEDFDLESRPFLQAVFKVLDCRENDYLVLFGICLLRAIQGNEGKFNFASLLFLCFGFGQYLLAINVFQCIFRVL